ncbi:MAG: dihydrodipicolinate synthase family protein [Solirubrobacterales bacterium]
MTGKASDQRMRGVIAPVLTPYGANLAPDPVRFVGFCRVLNGLGIGLAPFGTTGEGPSLSVDERIKLLDALVSAGLPMDRVMPGTGCTALTDTVRLSAHAAKLGCAGVLMLPPFYFKGVSDDGLFRAYAEAIERVGDARLKVYLYHFPRHAQVPLSHALIGRLAAAYPGTIVGIKDSSGDLAHTEGLCHAFPKLDVFSGSEAHLLKVLRAGGAGTINTNANVNGAVMVELCRNWQDDSADILQDAIAAFRQALRDVPLIPAVKALVALASGDDLWRLTRPPLIDLSREDEALMLRRLADAGFPVG